jgi:hypothetical protein
MRSRGAGGRHARRQPDRGDNPVMIEDRPASCQWCERHFRVRRGGSPQRFCGAKCRTMFWSALRRWGERAVAAGIVTIADLRNGASRSVHAGTKRQEQG